MLVCGCGLLLAGTLAGCGDDAGDTGRPATSGSAARTPAGTPSTSMTQGVDFATASKALARYQHDIRRQYPGVTGMGVGSVVNDRAADGKGWRIYGILVFVVASADLPERPQSIGGVPLKFQVSGPFTANPADGRT
ncbi:hypothetical protein E1287_15850 [Actinomadura sp. KC06]|uniref:hypothetical protein n=1 Tax=Actinomadura sp. KC06 TaxID=2530369 RepID=UPI0010464423|nr:hypothetical protein [Actinomadura sp. KC06]TDD34666.1 hypothetical protein E1287_15850 [Actinomadura sp. KC06]